MDASSAPIATHGTIGLFKPGAADARAQSDKKNNPPHGMRLAKGFVSSQEIVNRLESRLSDGGGDQRVQRSQAAQWRLVREPLCR